MLKKHNSEEDLSKKHYSKLSKKYFYSIE